MDEIERLSCVIVVMVYEMWYVVGCWLWIVRTLITDSVCYRKSLILGCEAVRDVLRVGFALAGVGVGVGALSGVRRRLVW